MGLPLQVEAYAAIVNKASTIMAMIFMVVVKVIDKLIIDGKHNFS